VVFPLVFFLSLAIKSVNHVEIFPPVTATVVLHALARMTIFLVQMFTKILFNRVHSINVILLDRRARHRRHSTPMRLAQIFLRVLNLRAPLAFNLAQLDRAISLIIVVTRIRNFKINRRIIFKQLAKLRDRVFALRKVSNVKLRADFHTTLRVHRVQPFIRRVNSAFIFLTIPPKILRKNVPVLCKMSIPLNPRKAKCL
jgi:hypothetical protein